MARIVFDLDGTLIDSAPDIHGIANAVLAGEGCEPITLEQTRDFIGNGASVFVQKMRAVRGISEGKHERLLAEFVGRYDDAVTLTLPYPGVVQALTELSSKHRLGICTNKPTSPCLSVLRHLDLDRFFDTVWGGDSMSVHKPDPAPLFAAFQELGDGPCLYVGDSDVDAETAARAGVPFLLFTEGYRKSPVAEIAHHAAFSDWTAIPRLVSGSLASAG